MELSIRIHFQNFRNQTNHPHKLQNQHTGSIKQETEAQIYKMTDQVTTFNIIKLGWHESDARTECRAYAMMESNQVKMQNFMMKHMTKSNEDDETESDEV